MVSPVIEGAERKPNNPSVTLLRVPSFPLNAVFSDSEVVVFKLI